MNKASFAFLGAMILSLVAGCGSMDALDADPALAAQDDPSLDMTSEIGQFQAPPIKIMIHDHDTPQVALVATSTAVGAYAAATEYWFGPPSLKPSGLSLRIDAAPIDLETEAAIAAFVDPLRQAFSTPRVIEASSWQRGQLRFPDGQIPYLFWAPHPDNEREFLGVVFVVDDRGQLVNTAWYRSTPPDTSGRAFDARLWSQPLTLVVDERGQPSADPNLIGPGDWYGIAMTPKSQMTQQ